MTYLNQVLNGFLLGTGLILAVLLFRFVFHVEVCL